MSAPVNEPVNEQLHEPPADQTEELEPGLAAELMFAVGVGLVIAGVGAFSTMTVAVVWSSLN